MAHHVPDFEMDPSSPTGGNKTLIEEDDEIMELLWQNGQVVAHNQNHRSLKKPTNSGARDDELPPPQLFSRGREIPSVDADTLSRQRNQNQNQQFFIQEDEMASWLQYPLEDYSLDREVFSDVIYSPISAPTSPQREVRSSVTELRRHPLFPPPVPAAPSNSIASPPPIAARTPISDGVEFPAVNFQNFLNFPRVSRARVESAPSSSSKAATEWTRAESNEPPNVGQNSRFSLAIGSSAQPSNVNDLGTSAMSTSTAGRDFTSTVDLTETASPGGSGASVNASVEATLAIHKPPLCMVEERKRKEREPDMEVNCHNEEQEDDFGSIELKKKSHKCTLVKRSRASEIHNLSERRRRDRINEKMRILSELIPHCNKVDKASMLEEAIEYLKSLQMQVQMMSMGCSMVPVMYNGAQQYMPAMGAGFPQLQAAAANLAPRFPMPAYPLQQIPVPDTARNPTSIQPYPMLHSLNTQGTNQVRLSTPMVDPYQHLVGFQQAQVPVHLQSVVHSQAVVHHSNDKPSSSRDAGKPGNEKTGLKGGKLSGTEMKFGKG